MKTLPVTFVWREFDIVDEQGVIEHRKVMDPLPRYGNICARQWVENEEYTLAVLEARSRASHNHYHACVAEGFKNLPENIAARWPTANHFRRWCLIEVDLFDEKDFDCDSEIAARRLGTFIRGVDEYARISIHGKKVIVRTAKSQSAAAMGKEAFESSKKQVLDLIESMVGVPTGTLKKEAGNAA